jgi:hypothetical protein
LSLLGTGPATFTVTETGYRGTYTVTSNNTNQVTVDTSPVTSSSDTTTIHITVPSNAQSTDNGGASSVTVSDTNGQQVVVPVTVTITNVTIQGKHRR